MALGVPPYMIFNYALHNSISGLARIYTLVNHGIFSAFRWAELVYGLCTADALARWQPCSCRRCRAARRPGLPRPRASMAVAARARLATRCCPRQAVNRRSASGLARSTWMMQGRR